MSHPKRVNVYKFVEGIWDDQGVGYLEFELESQGIPEIVVKAENEEGGNGEYLLKSKVDKGDIYLKYLENWIVWSEPSSITTSAPGVEISLSFQEAVRCKEFWEELIDFQNAMQNLSLESLILGTTPPEVELELPEPTVTNLESVNALLDRTPNEIISAVFIRKNYLATLFPLFRAMVAERNAQEKAIYLTKKLLLLNDPILLKYLCAHFFLDILFIFDGDTSSSGEHVRFIQNQAQFVEVLKLSENFEKIVHETFRLTYLKDQVLPEVLDVTSLICTIEIMISENCVELLSLFITSSLPGELFYKLKSSPAAALSFVNDALNLVLGLCTYNDTQTDLRNRSIFYMKMIQSGLLDALQLLMTHANLDVRKNCAQILLKMLESGCATLLRKYMIDQRNSGNQFLRALVLALKSEPHIVAKTLFAESLRGILDTLHVGPELEPLSTAAEPDPIEDEEKLVVVSLFYSEFAFTLFEALFVEPPAQLSPVESYFKFSMCDLVCQLIEHFATPSRTFILKYNFLARLFVMLKSKEKNSLLGPIRVLRKLIGAPNRAFFNYIIDNNFFAPIVQVLLENGDKYNALNSAILELFHFMSLPQNNCRLLVKHFIDNFYDRVKHVAYTPIFHSLQKQLEFPEFHHEAHPVQFFTDPVSDSRRKFQEYGRIEETSWIASQQPDDRHNANNTNNHNAPTRETPAEEITKRRRFEEISDASLRPKKIFKGP